MTDKPQDDLFVRTEIIADAKYILRKLRLKDSKRLHQLDTKCFQPDRAFTLGYFLLLFLYEEAYGWAYEHNGQIVAFILMTQKRNNANIATIDVDPEYRRNGLGAALMKHAQQHLLDSGLKSFTLQVEIDNDSAIALYKKFGFSIVKTLPNYYPENSAYLMRKQLLRQNISS